MKLMIKRHQDTGLKYLHYTNKEDDSKYLGSGVYWKRHLKKHGNNVISCLVLESDNQKLMTNYALYISEKCDVVESKEWANLVYESCNSSNSQPGKQNGMYGYEWTGLQLHHHSEVMKKYWNNPEVRQAQSKRRIKWFQNNTSPLIGTIKSESSKTKQSKTMKKLNEDHPEMALLQSNLRKEWHKHNTNGMQGKKRSKEFKEFNSKISKEWHKHNEHPRAIGVSVNGYSFNTKKEAYQTINISQSTLERRLRDPNNTDYKYL